MLSLLVFACLSSSVYADIFTPPMCITNYSTFMDQTIRYSRDNILNNYTSLTADECAQDCNQDPQCLGFNYYPSITSSHFESSCQLLDIVYNSSLLVNSFDNAYYYKSINDCSSEQRMMVVLYVCLGIVGLLILGCCLCRCCRRKRGYSELA